MKAKKEKNTKREVKRNKLGKKELSKISGGLVRTVSSSSGTIS